MNSSDVTVFVIGFSFFSRPLFRLIRFDGPWSDRVEDLRKHWLWQGETICQSHHSRAKPWKLFIVHFAFGQRFGQLVVDHSAGWFNVGACRCDRIYDRHRSFRWNHSAGNAIPVLTIFENSSVVYIFFPFFSAKRSGHLFSLWISYRSPHSLGYQIFHVSYLPDVLSYFPGIGSHTGRGAGSLLQPREA